MTPSPICRRTRKHPLGAAGLGGPWRSQPGAGAAAQPAASLPGPGPCLCGCPGSTRPTPLVLWLSSGSARRRQTPSAASSPAAPTTSPVCWTRCTPSPTPSSRCPPSASSPAPKVSGCSQVWSRCGGPGGGRRLEDHPCQGSLLAEAAGAAPWRDVGLGLGMLTPPRFCISSVSSDHKATRVLPVPCPQFSGGGVDLIWGITVVQQIAIKC